MGVTSVAPILLLNNNHDFTMNNYSVIMEHWQTHKIMFLKVTDCKDMDECIEHVKREHPDYNLERISPIKWSTHPQLKNCRNKQSNPLVTWSGWYALQALTTQHVLSHGRKHQAQTTDSSPTGAESWPLLTVNAWLKPSDVHPMS